MMKEITARCDVAIEIYSNLINKTKCLLEEKFGKPTSYFDAERQRAIGIAHDIFTSCVSLDDITRLANDKTSPEVIDMSNIDSPRNAKEFMASEEAVQEIISVKPCVDQDECSGNCG